MKHLRRFNESAQDDVEIRDSMQEFTDSFGQAEVTNSINGGTKYTWKIGAATSAMIDRDELERLIGTYEGIKDNALTLADRLADRHTVMFNLTPSEFSVNLLGKGHYRFIKGVEKDTFDLTVLISRQEIERWAQDNGLKLAGHEEDEVENNTNLRLRFTGEDMYDKLEELDWLMNDQRNLNDDANVFYTSWDDDGEFYLGVDEEDFEDTHIKLA